MLCVSQLCRIVETEWQNDIVTKWPSDQVTKWPSDQVAKWPSGQVTKWPSDKMTEWPSDQVTKWQEASQTIYRMVYLVITDWRPKKLSISYELCLRYNQLCEEGVHVDISIHQQERV